jgi:hypothetical protein
MVPIEDSLIRDVHPFGDPQAVMIGVYLGAYSSPLVDAETLLPPEEYDWLPLIAQVGWMLGVHCQQIAQGIDYRGLVGEERTGGFEVHSGVEAPGGGQV